jgi:hypothetical protein
MKYTSELFARVGVVACGVLFLQHAVSLLLGMRHGGVSNPDSTDTLLFGIGLIACLLTWIRFTRSLEQV